MRLTALVLLAIGCGDKVSNQGELGARCYPNGTCNVTLRCVGGLCVAEPDDADVADVPPTDAEIDAAESDAGVDAPLDAYCVPISASPPSGHHNPGVGCRTGAGCHNAQLGLGTNAPEYSVAGTVYKDTAGTLQYAGVTVSVTVEGMTQTAVTANNGNFWFAPAILPSPTATATGTTSVSGCPNAMAMTGQLVGGGGDCNNCHRNGGSTAPITLAP